MDLLDMFEELDRGERDSGGAPRARGECLKAPFGWPGGKSKSLDKILPHLPYYNTYVEVFGGAGSVLLARDKCKMEVYNDRFGGVVDFYRVLRDPKLSEQLFTRLNNTVHAREEFLLCLETWENVEDPVERAARWYYTIAYSFAAKGKTFGRSVSGANCMSGKIQGNIQLFEPVKKRLEKVLIENLDFRQIFKDFDKHDAVFYCDPPYMHASSTHYKHEMQMSDHKALLECIFNAQGFVALSGYPNELYDSYPWDEKKVWEQFVSVQGEVYKEENNLAHLKGLKERGMTTECLWIKEAR
jgi:DNA adenine methylase